MAERCFWCGIDPDEAAKRFEGPHLTWCLRFSGAVAKRPPKIIFESNPGTPPDPRLPLTVTDQPPSSR